MREWELSFRLGMQNAPLYRKIKVRTGLIVKDAKLKLFVLQVTMLIVVNTLLFNRCRTSVLTGDRGPAPVVYLSLQESSASSEEYKDSNFTATKPSDDELNNKISKGIDPYLEFIEQASQRAEENLKQNATFYVEIHHIVPRFDGGTDDPSNLVRLSYNDHAIAHYIRWFLYKKPQDLVAFNVMSGQTQDIRRERAKLGGSLGGTLAQKMHKERGIGWFDKQGQSERGKKGVNREQKTGAYDPENLRRANQVIRENPELYRPQQVKNLAQGRKTQKEKGIGLGDPDKQRLKSLMRFGYIVLDGKAYSLNTEHRIYVCETTLAYYLRFAPRKK